MSKQILKIDFYNFYLKNREIDVRVKVGVQDEIYPGVYVKTLQCSFKPHLIREALNFGFIKHKHIRHADGSIRGVYAFTVEKMPQRKWYKKAIEKVRGFFDKDFYKDF